MDERWLAPSRVPWTGCVVRRVGEGASMRARPQRGSWTPGPWLSPPVVSLLAILLMVITPGVAAARQPAPPGTLPGPTAGPNLAWLNVIAPCTYYVAEHNAGGRDTNPGTVAQPWESISKVIGALKAGETGCVK